MPQRERMSSVDTAWLRMDSPTNLMMIVGVLIFDGAIDFARLKRTFEFRLLSYRRFRQRVVPDISGTWWELDPNFDISEVGKPFALKLAADKLAPGRLGKNLVHELWYAGQALRRLPRDLRTLSRKLLDGSLQVTLRISEFDNALRELDRATNRLAFSIIVSGIVIGSSVVLHAKVPPVMDRFPGALGRFFAHYMPDTSALGLAGFLFAGILGMLLTVAIWRSGRL